MLLMQVSKCWKIAKFPKFQLKWKVSKHFTRPKQRVTVRKLLSPHRRNASYSSAILEKNICRLFHVSAQFLFTTSEMKLDYYQQKVNVRVVSRVVESPEQQILGNFEKIPEMLGMMASTQPTIHKPNFDIRAKISRKIICQSLHSKICCKQFLKLSKIFRQRLWNKNFFTKIYQNIQTFAFQALWECTPWAPRNGAVPIPLSDTNQKYACWKTCKVIKAFACVAGVYFLQCWVSRGS